MVPSWFPQHPPLLSSLLHTPLPAFSSLPLHSPHMAQGCFFFSLSFTRKTAIGPKKGAGGIWRSCDARQQLKALDEPNQSFKHLRQNIEVALILSVYKNSNLKYTLNFIQEMQVVPGTMKEIDR